MTTDADLNALADEAGLHVEWVDQGGRRQTVSPDTLRSVLAALKLPAGSASEIADSRERLRREAQAGQATFLTAEVGRSVKLPPGLASGTARLTLEGGGQLDLRPDGGELPPLTETGYHRLAIGDHEFTLAVAPRAAMGIPDIAPGRRLFGLATQIYSISDRRRDFGDFGSLADFAEAAARSGVDAVAVSPTHALFAADPTRYSPYAPSTRLFHNVLFGDPAAIGDTGGDRAPSRPGDDLIDWPSAAAAKLAALRGAFERLRSGTGGDANREDFERFRRSGGSLLEEHARFEALHAHFKERTGAGGWQGWDEPYRDPASPAVESFAREHADEVTFHVFLQWLADRSFTAAHRRARDAGMCIGLIADLAVGMDGGGSHAWSRREDVLNDLSVGAPPDLLGPKGQNWGLTTFSPRALTQGGFAPFLATLRAAMGPAGGVRIDHALGLKRLWVIPEGAGATEGVYLTYPLEDMLRLIALESCRHRAIVVGEDLGTVPPGFPETLAEHGILGMRVLFFERDGGHFHPPRQWTAQAAALTTTHDLPTVAGWWRGRDIHWREELDIVSSKEDAEAQRRDREADRSRLWDAFRQAGVAEGERPAEADTDPVVDAALRFVGRTPCHLALVPAEDICGLAEQPNLPGTIDEHPNWRRRLPEDALEAPQARRRLDLLARERSPS